MHDPANQAPGTLELVRKFVNTDDIYNGRDELGNEGSATAWLAKSGVLNGDRPITDNDLAALYDLRDTLRALAAANATGEQTPREVVDAFNRLSAPHAASVCLDVAHGSLVGFLRADDDGAGGAIAALAAAVHQAVLTGTWTRLKSCANSECRLAVLRRVTQPDGPLVQHAGLRQRHQGPPLPGEAAPAGRPVANPPALAVARTPE